MEFLRYPQVIRHHCNGGRFGPPWSFTSTSTCSWIGHPVSGLRHATIALFRLAFASAPNLQFLTSLHNVTRRSVLQKVHDRTFIVLSLLVNTGFQVLFHSPPGVLFTFPSQYCFTIGHWGVFRLGGWSPRLPTGFLVSRGTLDPARWLPISPTGFSPSLTGFPKTVRLSSSNAVRSPQPRRTRSFGLASFPFARRYSGNRVFFLLLLLLRCFSSQRSPPHAMDSRTDT